MEPIFHAGLPRASVQSLDAPLSSQRYRSLDGLRGVAALIVVVYHLLQVVPALAAAHFVSAAPLFSPSWWLEKTPVRLLFAGHEAVLIFFVLSGIVLTLPLRPAGSRPFRWEPYYPRRLARLYLPVWGSLVIALALAVAVPRNTLAASRWVATHRPPTVTAVVKDFFLLIGTSNLDSPLWSLRWEVWFSLLLPVLFMLIRLVRMERWWLGGITLLTVVSALAQFDILDRIVPGAFLTVGLLQYLPVFGIGMIIALNLERVHAFGARLRSASASRAKGIALGLVAVLLTTSPSLLPSQRPGFGISDAVTYALSIVGVLIIVFAAITTRPLQSFLERRPVQWLGSRSFSIYLVHEPLVVAAALIVGPTSYFPWLLVAVGLLPVVFMFAEAFFRLVSGPLTDSRGWWAIGWNNEQTPSGLQRPRRPALCGHPDR